MKSENLDLRNEGSCEHMNYLKEDHNVCIHEIVDDIGKPQECVEQRGKLLENKDTVKGNYGDLVGVSQDYRNKSEKKLN
ncbi:hypothetical protein Tco_0589500, partial [Tanacetum coccineum]